MRRLFEHYYISSKPFAQAGSLGWRRAISANWDKNRLDIREIDSASCISGLPSLTWHDLFFASYPEDFLCSCLAFSYRILDCRGRKICVLIYVRMLLFSRYVPNALDLCSSFHLEFIVFRLDFAPGFNVQFGNVRMFFHYFVELVYESQILRNHPGHLYIVQSLIAKNDVPCPMQHFWKVFRQRFNGLWVILHNNDLLFCHRR